jgi:hypothetical protein
MKSKYRHRLCEKLFKTETLSNTTKHGILSSTSFSLICGELFTIFDEQIRLNKEQNY